MLKTGYVALDALSDKKRKLVNSADFLTFANFQKSKGDCNVHVNLLRCLCTVHGLQLHDRVWLAILYAAYGSEGSMWVAYNRKGVRERKQLPPVNLPITAFRRNFHGGRILRHFQAWHAIPRLGPWVMEAQTWNELVHQIKAIWGNGDSTAYFTAELIRQISGIELDADCSPYRILSSPEARLGMKALGLVANEAEADWLRFWLLQKEVELTQCELKSVLEDWYRMWAGKFYPGRNIDLQRNRLLAVEAYCRMHSMVVDLEAVWVARRKLFTGLDLAHAHDWNKSVERKRLATYKNDKVVLPPLGGTPLLDVE